MATEIQTKMKYLMNHASQCSQLLRPISFIDSYMTSTTLSCDITYNNQNAAARLVTSTQRCDHITPVLRQLHWLPVRQQIHFKPAGCVFQALTSQDDAYLANDSRLLSDSDRRKLRSSDIRTCVTPLSPPRTSMTRVFQLLVLEFGTVSRLQTWLFIISNQVWWNVST